MKTTITERGQTVVPSVLRKKYGLPKGTELERLDTGDLIKVVPVPKDLIKSLRGCAKGEKLTQKLLKARKRG